MRTMIQRVADAHEAKALKKIKITPDDLSMKPRLGPEYTTTRRPGGPMHTRQDDFDMGRSKHRKHKKPWGDE